MKGEKWRWLGAEALVVDVGKRPVVLAAGRTAGGGPVFLERGEDGLLRAFDPQRRNGQILSLAPELLQALRHAVAGEELAAKCAVCGSSEVDCWKAEAVALLRRAPE